MKILFITPEATPFAQVGGLADVAGSLPKALRKLGHDVRIVLPRYGCIQKKEDWKLDKNPLEVHLGEGRILQAGLWEAKVPHTDIPVYLLEYNQYFERHEIYTGPWGDHSDNHERFTFLSRAGLDLCYHLDWIPDVIHCHDWPTGLVPVYLNTIERYKPLGQAATVFTIHSLRHQGVFGPETLQFAGLPAWLLRNDGLECVGNINMLKGALYHATKITAVSPHYAQEIRGPQFGCGLEDVLRFRGADLIGVLNGIDTDFWDPQTDKRLPAHFSTKDLSGKALCKETLQKAFNLKKDPNIPIFGAVARLYDQKGLDLLAAIIPRLIAEMKIQVIVVGAGDPTLEHLFSHYANAYPGQVGAYIGYCPKLSHLVFSGADFFVMPSRFEPCGLTQMYAMNYGTLPIARATGGLVDTIESYNEQEETGTGFLFGEASTNGLYYTIGWACATYYDKPKAIKKLQKNAMQKEFSWDRSAKKYTDIYQWAIDARTRHH
tara:strand:+ start:25710 stop:27179 length:1470 start_codon:yes stop_codon:yes gene_type:complete